MSKEENVFGYVGSGDEASLHSSRPMANKMMSDDWEKRSNRPTPAPSRDGGASVQPRPAPAPSSPPPPQRK